MARTRMTIASLFAAFGAATAACDPALAQPWPQQSDYVCTATSSAGEKDDQRFQIDLKNKAWCTSKDDCKEVKTIFGEKDARVILESSQLEFTSFETSIDRGGGRYDSAVTTGGFTTESHGTCKAAAFTPFKVTVDGSKIRGG